MKNKILATVSVIALMGAMPALAQKAKTQTQINAEASTSGNMSEDAKKAWKNIKSDTSDAYDEIKASLMDSEEPSNKSKHIIIESRKTANGIIGHAVYNERQEKIAEVTDIIIDNNGQAMMVIVADGAFIGTGKKAAFDYSVITRVDKDGDVIMPISERNIDNAATFSYDREDSADDVRIIPNNGYSVAKLLDGKLVNQKQETIADIENISFKNNSANHLIVGFDKMLGMGGEMLILSFRDTKILQDGEDVNFQLNAKKSAQFEIYKKTSAN